MSDLEQKLDYSFKDIKLLDEALMHPSFLCNKKYATIPHKNYQRLEFLGDSVLNLSIASILYSRFTDYNEGKLSVMHSYLVKTDSLARVARDIELGKYIVMDQGEELMGGRDKPRNLENALEAIIGAIFLDSGYSAVEPIVEKLWHELLEESIDVDKIKDYKSKLQEWVQKHGQKIPQYVIEKADGPAHNPTFTVAVYVDNLPSVMAIGKSKKIAEQEAAKLMLETILKDVL